MVAPNPVEDAQSSASSVSNKTFHIAGILTTVYGLDELPKECKSVSTLWLLHPRHQTKAIMGSIANHCINDWNTRRQKSPDTAKKGLIAVAFDQRNHGSREVDPVANEAWKKGNPRHAQDMFGIFQGTAMDTSLLIDHLGSYIFPEPDSPALDENLVLGISLGGHSTWHALFHEPRITAGVVIIGCPDYMYLMSNRAKNAGLDTYNPEDPVAFLGSKDFPSALVTSMEKWDPKGLLFSKSEVPSELSSGEQSRVRGLLDSTIKGKRFLVCSGGDDKLVPYRCSRPLVELLSKATGQGGWYEDGGVYIENNVYDGIGHKFSEGMTKDAVRFVSDTLAGVKSIGTGRTSKI